MDLFNNIYTDLISTLYPVSFTGHFLWAGGLWRTPPSNLRVPRTRPPTTTDSIAIRLLLLREVTLERESDSALRETHALAILNGFMVLLCV